MAGDSDHLSAPADPPPPDTVAPLAPCVTVQAHTYLHRWTTSSQPVKLKCDDGQAYVVKGRQTGNPAASRMMVADHITGRLGALLGAPVPPIAFVVVPAELAAAEPQMAHLTPGISHGSRFVDGVSEAAEGLSQTTVPENRSRYALLAVLYGWIGASDPQFLYEKNSPRRVYSHDHGHFFPGSTNWSAHTLTDYGAELDASLIGSCAFSPAEIADAVARLRQLEAAHIGNIVAGIPADWGVSQEEREAMREFLEKRRESILTKHSPTEPA